MTRLHNAVEDGDIDLVRDILQRDPSCVNDRNPSFETPLHKVFTNVNRDIQHDDRLPIIKELLSYGAGVNLQSGCYNDTPLHNAKNQFQGIKLLLENKADPNIRNHFNDTALHDAVNEENDEIVKLLLQNGADVNAVNYLGKTPLDYAIISKSFNQVRLLVDAGAKARNLCDSLFTEDFLERADRIEYIVKNGAKMDLFNQISLKALYFKNVNVNNHSSNTPCSHVLAMEHFLHEQGVDVNDWKRSGEEMTELHIAVQKKNENQVSMFLRNNADVNAKNIFNDTPLHLLFSWYKGKLPYERTFIRIARLLIKAGADITARNCNNWTPLQLAIEWRKPDLINMMLSQYTGVHEHLLTKKWELIELSRTLFNNNYNLCPLDLAIIFRYEKVVDRLIEMGKHIVASSDSYKDRRFPLFYSVQYGHYDISKMLLEAGCRIDRRFPFCIPSIKDCSKSEDTDIRTACLFWEFKDDIFIFEELVYYFNIMDPNKLTDTSIFFLTIDLYLNKPKENFVPMQKLIKLNRNFITAFAKANKKLMELKEVKLDKSLCVSLHDILLKPLDSLVKFLVDKANFDACKTLLSNLQCKDPLEDYEYILLIRIDLAIEKRLILNRAKNNFNDAISCLLQYYDTLPDEITWSIFDYLTVRELKKIAGKY